MQIPDAYISRMVATQPEIESLITFFKSREFPLIFKLHAATAECNC